MQVRKLLRTATVGAALTTLALVAGLLQGTAAQAGQDGRAKVKVDVSAGALDTGRAVAGDGVKFVAQARAAGLTAAQAHGLQVKADKYLGAFGKEASQVGPDKIVFGGASLLLAVPGEAQPRGLSSSADRQMAISCPYTYFCAYSAQWFTGDAFLLEQCGWNTYIPWSTTGSWKNNQTSGTQPWLYFWDGQSPWHMPGAYAEQASGVGWFPVDSIVPC